MATMYSLFLGILFTALCSDNGDESGVLNALYAPKPPVQSTYSFVFSLRPQLSFSMTRISCFSSLDCSLKELKSLFEGISLMKKTKQKKSRLGQYDAKYFMTGLNISEPLYFASLHRYVFYDHQKIFLTLYRPRSLEDQKSRTRTVSQPRPFYLASASSPLQSEIIDNSLRLAQPRPIYSDTARSSLQSRLMSPVKHFAVKNDLLAYGIKGRKATSYNSVHFALGQDSQSKGGTRALETLGTACVALLSRDEHRVNSLDFFVLFDQAKSTSSSGDEDNNKIRNNKTLLAESRQSILEIASKELGTREATGNNDGSRVEEYHETYHSCPDYRVLHYHNLYHFHHFLFLPNAKGEG